MRVLHILPNLRLDAGGPSQSVPELCRALAADGAEVMLHSIGSDHDSISSSDLTDGFSILYSEPFPGSSSFPSTHYYAQLCSVLGSIDIVQLNGLWNPAISLAGRACRQTRTPYIISSRGMMQRTAMKWKRVRKMLYYLLCERRTISGAAAIHFFSEADRLESRQLLGDHPRTVVIPNGVDPNLSARIERNVFRPLYPNLLGKKLILTVGRLHWSKGLDVQCEAIALLSKRYTNFVWVLIGPDQGEWGRIEGRLDAAGIRENVLWTGLLPRSTCLQAMADADLFLLTSRHEGHSMAMNEALALGCPVVIADSVRFEPLARCGAGVVTPRSADAIAEAIEGILRDNAKAAKMSESAGELVTRELGWPRVGAETLSLYEDVLSAHSPT